MRRTIIPVLLALAPAPAAAETLWVGNVFVTAVSNKCGTGLQVNDFGRVLFRPAGTALGNGANSYFAFFTQRSSYGMIVPGNSFQFGVNYTGQLVSTRLSVTSRAGGVTQWVMNPSTPATNTHAITLTASIANFLALKGCTVTLVAAMQQLPQD